MTSRLSSAHLCGNSVFELVSAYGTVGLSLGIPYVSLEDHYISGSYP